MALMEADLQKAIVRWADTLIPKIPEFRWLHAVPNGGKRNSFEAQGLKDQGVKAGILDLSLDVARGGYHGLKAELKRPGGNCLPPTPEQLEYMIFCEQQGYFCFISNDFDHIKETLLRYIGGGIIRES